MHKHPSPHRTLNHLATAGIGLGAALAACGAAAFAVAPFTPMGLPEAIIGRMPGVVTGAILAALGVGLVLRGVSLRVALQTLAAVAAVRPVSIPKEEAVLARWEPRRVDPDDPAPQGDVHLAKPRTLPVSSAVPPRSDVKDATAISSRSTQTVTRASRDAPIKGKPFQPHPIFMTRPPR